MEEVTTGFVGKFGLDLRLLLAQILNFSVILVVLAKFVYRPLLKIMRERSERIAAGLRDTEAIAVERKAFIIWQEGEQQKTKAEAAARLAQAEEEARHRRDVVLRGAEEDAQAMHDRASADAARLQEDAFARAREDAGVLVVELTERILGKRLSATDRDAVLQDALQEVRKLARGSR